MFVSLGVDLSSASTPEGIDKIQKIMVVVQQQVYRLQGSINKLVMDDKGSTLICIWGLPPLTNTDDASRAVHSGFNMIKALKQIDNTYCNIGIASGECFCGVVGTSGSRKEFSVLGDIVNLAARIMGSMKGKTNQIRCDLNTRKLASSNFVFKYHSHNELKGKSISTPFYQPLDPDKEALHHRNKVLDPEHFLLTHQNPLIYPRDTNVTEKTDTIGFDQLLDQLSDEVTEYFISDYNHKAPYLAVIQGEMGSGKTAFMRHLLDKLKTKRDFEGYLDNNKHKLPIFASTISCESQLHYLNAWRPIYQMLSKFYCKKQKNKHKNQFIADCLLKHPLKHMQQLVCEMLGVDTEHLSKATKAELKCPQVEERKCPDAFIKLPEYNEENTEQLCQFLVNLFVLLIGNKDDLSDWQSHQLSNSNSSVSVNERKKSQVHSSEEDQMKDPIMIVIDNAHLMCPTSWALFELIIAETEGVAFFLIMQSDDRARLRIPKESQAAFNLTWQTIDSDSSLNIRMVDMPQLSGEAIEQLIVQNALNYRRSAMQEIDDMTKIIDMESTIKDPEGSKQMKNTLQTQWQTKFVIKTVDPDIIKKLQSTCNGNPLINMEYFVNMLQNGFVVVSSDGHCRPDERYITCQTLNDFSAVPCPRFAFVQNQSALSSFIAEFVFKKDSHAQEQAYTAIVLLKTSAVLGREFTLDSLKYLSPLHRDLRHDERVEEAVRLLESRDLLEIIDQKGTGNFACRLQKGLIHSSLYQTLRYKQLKKEFHQQTELLLQTAPESFAQRDSSLKVDVLLHHMLQAEDCKQESQLNLERRKALTVTRIQQQILQDPEQAIYFESIQKLPSSGLQQIKPNEIKKALPRMFLLTRFRLKWFHDQQEAIEDKYIGNIELCNINQLTQVPQKNTDKNCFVLCLHVTMHLNRKQKQVGSRKIFLNFETRIDSDRWVAAIDYLKTRQIYDAYTKNNQLVNFLGHGKSKNAIEQELTMHKVDDLLYEFPEKLKARTSSVVVKSPVKKFNLASRGSFRRQTSLPQSNFTVQKTPLKANDIVKALKMLYQTGMTSFLHQITSSGVRDSRQVQVSKQSVDIYEPMHFPNGTLDWDIYSEINTQNDMIEEVQSEQSQSSERSMLRSSTIQKTLSMRQRGNPRASVMQTGSRSPLNQSHLQSLRRADSQTNTIERNMAHRQDSSHSTDSRLIRQIISNTNSSGQQTAKMIQKTIPVEINIQLQKNRKRDLSPMSDQQISSQSKNQNDDTQIKPEIRMSSISADNFQQAMMKMNEGIQEVNEEHSSSDLSNQSPETLNQNALQMPKVQPEYQRQPSKSMIENKHIQDLIVRSPSSSATRVSEQVRNANIDVATVQNSDSINHNPNNTQQSHEQHRYESVRNRAQTGLEESKQPAVNISNQNMNHMSNKLQSQQATIELLLKSQEEIAAKMQSYERLLSPPPKSDLLQTPPTKVQQRHQQPRPSVQSATFANFNNGSTTHTSNSFGLLKHQSLDRRINSYQSEQEERKGENSRNFRQHSLNTNAELERVQSPAFPLRSQQSLQYNRASSRAKNNDNNVIKQRIDSHITMDNIQGQFFDKQKQPSSRREMTAKIITNGLNLSISKHESELEDSDDEGQTSAQDRIRNVYRSRANQNPHQRQVAVQFHRTTQQKQQSSSPKKAAPFSSTKSSIDLSPARIPSLRELLKKNSRQI